MGVEIYISDAAQEGVSELPKSEGMNMRKTYILEGKPEFSVGSMMAGM